MYVDACHFIGVHGWCEGNDTADWSHDVELAPSSVLCTANLSSLEIYNAGAANAGIVQYRTRDPNTGIDTVHDLPGVSSPVLVGLTPAIYDDNVDSITFYVDLESASGDVYTMALFNILFWLR
jgi:hypothetical protein